MILMQTNLFEPLLDATLCDYGGEGPGARCQRPATHVAVGAWIRDLHPTEQGQARKRCCLDHANYYANAWCPMYPNSRDSAWLEVL